MGEVKDSRAPIIPPRGAGREYLVPLVLMGRRVEMWICWLPSSLRVTLTRFSVLLPHRGQNFRSICGVVWKQP